MKKGPRRFLIVLGILGALALAIILSINITKNWVSTVSWDDPKLEQIADGDYPGESHLVLPPGAAAATSAIKLVVHVKDHRYAGFDIVEPVSAIPMVADISAKVLNQQTLKPDAISGPTVTNTAFLTAAAKALAPK